MTDTLSGYDKETVRNSVVARIRDTAALASEFGITLGDPKYIISRSTEKALYKHSVTLVWDTEPGRCADDNYPYRCAIYRGNDKAAADYAYVFAVSTWKLACLSPEAYSLTVNFMKAEAERGVRVVSVLSEADADRLGTGISVVFEDSQTVYRLPIGAKAQVWLKEPAKELAHQLRHVLENRKSKEIAVNNDKEAEIESSAFQQLEALGVNEHSPGFLCMLFGGDNVQLCWNVGKDMHKVLWEDTASLAGTLYEVMKTCADVFKLGIEKGAEPLEFDFELLGLDSKAHMSNVQKALVDHSNKSMDFIEAFCDMSEALDKTTLYADAYAETREALLRVFPEPCKDTGSDYQTMMHVAMELLEAAKAMPPAAVRARIRQAAATLKARLNAHGLAEENEAPEGRAD